MLDLPPGTPCRSWRDRCDARHGSGRSAGDLPMGRWWVRSESRRLSRSTWSPRPPVVPWAQPVKWAETRSEDMVSLVHGRDYVMTAKLGVTNDGKITGLEGDVTANAGSYPAIGAILPMLTQMMCVGVYDIDKVKFATRARDDQHDDGRRIPWRRSPGSHSADRAGHRHCCTEDRDGSRRDPPP